MHIKQTKLELKAGLSITLISLAFPILLTQHTQQFCTTVQGRRTWGASQGGAAIPFQYLRSLLIKRSSSYDPGQ